MDRWITIKEFAKRAGVIEATARAHVMNHCTYKKQNGVLVVDSDDPKAIKYIEKKRQKQKHRENLHNSNLNIEKLLNPTNPIDINGLEKSLGLENLKNITTVRSKEASTQLQRLKIAVQRNQLIDRKIVESILFGYLNTLNNRMFDLLAQNIDRVIALVEKEGKEARSKLMEKLSNEVGIAIKTTKREIKKTLIKINKDIILQE